MAANYLDFILDLGDKQENVKSQAKYRRLMIIILCAGTVAVRVHVPRLIAELPGEFTGL